MSDAKRKALIEFLDEKVFSPVLNTDISKWPVDNQLSYKDISWRVRNTQNRYRYEYPDAQSVVNNFRLDLHSSAGKDLAEKMKYLGLPTFEDVADKFHALVRGAAENE